MSKTKFITGEYYHIFNRGVEKRDIFLEDNDLIRFVYYLYLLNDSNPLAGFFRRMIATDTNAARPRSFNPLSFVPKSMNAARPRSYEREVLVDIFSWTLMPNHFHLFLQQVTDNGISKFMQKLGTAWTEFFNFKYNRAGVLFQGRFKVVPVNSEAQTICLTNYIHLNPIDLVESGWKENGIKQPKEILGFLENYRWSSYLDYIGKKNFPLIINTDFLKHIVGDSENLKKTIEEIIFDNLKLSDFLNDSKSIIVN